LIKNPIDLQIERKDIFYRVSFSDVIDYVKFLLSPEALSSKIKKFSPKGSILIDAPYGSDIIGYMKLIAKTFTVKFVGLNYIEIMKSPENFILNFPDIINSLAAIFKDIEKAEQEIKDSDKLIERALKFMFVIENRDEIFHQIHNEIDFELFERLHYELEGKTEEINFIENGIILVGINYQENKLRHSSFKLFDFYLKIPRITENERRVVLEKIQEEISENQTFNVDKIATLTDGWEVNDIRELINVAYLRNASKMDDSTNDLTSLIEKIIDKGECIPSYLVSLNFYQNKFRNFQSYPNSSAPHMINQNKRFNKELSKDDIGKAHQVERELKTQIEKIKSQRMSDFMIQQLYEEAASENYTELLVIIDKMKKKEPLEDFDMKLLAEYSFILNDPPNIALILLEKAKKRIDNIKKAFGN